VVTSGGKTWLTTVTVTVTLQLAVYRQSVCLGAKLLETHDQRFHFLFIYLFFATETLQS
jgi:hypothetical protein